MIILCLALLLAPAVRAEESFEESVEAAVSARRKEDVIERLAREYAYDPALRPETSTTTSAAMDRIVLRYSLEVEKDQWKDLATMTMTRRTFERYEERRRRWEMSSTLRRFGDEDPNDILGGFGGRDAAAAVDIIFTSLANDPRIQGHPWLEGTANFFIGTMELIDQIDNATFLDVFGFEVDDFMSDRFGIGRDRAAGPAIGPGGGSSDGQFHGRLRVGVSGIERVAAQFDGDALKLRAKYEISCPSDFILDKVEVGVESRPFCRKNDDSLRFYIGGRKSF